MNIKEIYDFIKNDKDIIEQYQKIDIKEDIDKNWAHHNFEHVLNVSNLSEQILSELNYDEEIIYSTKIAAILHDTGMFEGKKDHAVRSYNNAIKYFKKNNIQFNKEDEVLEAIKIHSDGFNTDSIIALALIFADKLDIKKSRVTKEGLNIVGMRQYIFIEDIIIKIYSNELSIDFCIDKNANIIELSEFYFTKKVFEAIKSFSKKINMNYNVFINSEKWNI